MESCSRQCLRRTLYAVMIGISPIVLGLLLIAIGRLILHQLETAYYRRLKPGDRRRSSSMFHLAGRPTLSYTPISTIELQRIIQGNQSNDSCSTQPRSERDSPIASRFMKSILALREPSPSAVSTGTLANLVIRRSAIGSTPLTALFAPASTSATDTVETIDERKSKRPGGFLITHESIETTTLAAGNKENGVRFFDTNNSFDAEQLESDPLLLAPGATTTTTTTTTVMVEEFLDFHSARSVPYSMNAAN